MIIFAEDNPRKIFFLLLLLSLSLSLDRQSLTWEHALPYVGHVVPKFLSLPGDELSKYPLGLRAL